MKKRSCILLAAVILLTGCGGKEESVQTSAVQQTTSSVIVETVQASVQETEETAASVPAEDEETIAPAETAEPAYETEIAETVESGFDQYAELIMQYENTFLGLPQKDKVYIFASTGEQTELDGRTCHAVSCYDEHEGVLYYMCDFFISEDGSAVYRYYASDDRYSLLPETSVFVPMDPGTQTPEEIFAKAYELYGYFDLSALDGWYDKTLEVEVDGRPWTYYMVSDERYDTKAEMLEALRGYFSDDIINSLMDTLIYREGMDGKLYSTGGARGADIYYVSSEYELTVLTADSALYTVRSVYEDELGNSATEEYEYNAVKRDGRWYFINFKLPY